MIKHTHNRFDEAKYYASLPKDGTVHPSFEQAVEHSVIRQAKKLYGRSKYHPSGRLYTRDERPWLFGG